MRYVWIIVLAFFWGCQSYQPEYNAPVSPAPSGYQFGQPTPRDVWGQMGLELEGRKNYSSPVNAAFMYDVEFLYARFAFRRSAVAPKTYNASLLFETPDSPGRDFSADPDGFCYTRNVFCAGRGQWPLETAACRYTEDKHFYFIEFKISHYAIRTMGNTLTVTAQAFGRYTHPSKHHPLTFKARGTKKMKFHFPSGDKKFKFVPDKTLPAGEDTPKSN